MFIIDGECPKCGRVVTRAHTKHLAMCTGKPAYEPTLQELVALEVSKMANLEKKLTELEIGGLIDLTQEGAVFMVVGSTGSATHLHDRSIVATFCKQDIHYGEDKVVHRQSLHSL